MRTIEDICKEHNLNVIPPISYKELLKQIYYNFDKVTLQNLMNDVMEEETQYGERIFD